MNDKKALLVVDVQNDFCPGGNLAVKEGDSIIDVLNKYIDLFVQKGYLVFASRDWHPEETSHFKEYGGQWPSHCVQNSKGAQFHPQLRLPENAIILSKGMDSREHGYSAFQGEDADGNSFSSLLEKKNINELFIGGLATDYCIKNSVIDALDKGYKTFLLTDAIKGVQSETSDAAKLEMNQKGVVPLTYDKVTQQFR